MVCNPAAPCGCAGHPWPEPCACVAIDPIKPGMPRGPAIDPIKPGMPRGPAIDPIKPGMPRGPAIDPIKLRPGMPNKAV